MVYRYVGVAPFSDKNSELLQVVEPLRVVVLRIDERQQQEAEAAHGCSSDALRCYRSIVMRRRVGGVALPLPCKFGCPAGEGNAQSLSQILCGLPEVRLETRPPGDPSRARALANKYVHTKIVRVRAIESTWAGRNLFIRRGNDAPEAPAAFKRSV